MFRTGEADELMNKVSALSVLSNAVLVWSTTRMAEIVGALETTFGQAIASGDLARIPPLLSARLPLQPSAASMAVHSSTYGLRRRPN